MNTYAQAHRGLVLILIAALLWGTVGVATKTIYTLADTTALSVGFLRLAIATPVLLLACWRACGRHAFRIAPRDLPLMLLIGVTMALYQVCFLGAIPRIGVAMTTLITLCTAPVIVALLAAALLGEALTSRVVLALVAALAGTVMLSWTNPSGLAGRHATLVGVGLALSSALGYSIRARVRYHRQLLTDGMGAAAVLGDCSDRTGVCRVPHGYGTYHRDGFLHHHVDRAADRDGAGVAAVRRAVGAPRVARRGIAARGHWAVVSRFNAARAKVVT